MNKEDIIKYCIDNLEGVQLKNSFSEETIFYNPENKLKRGVYVITIKDNDGKNDRASNLSRKDVYRLNIGVKKETFQSLFGKPPARPAAGETVNMNYDFTTLNKILPHPIYAWMSWVSVLNPSEALFTKDVQSLIDEAYDNAVIKYNKKQL